jgi:hypothetical protein
VHSGAQILSADIIYCTESNATAAVMLLLYCCRILTKPCSQLGRSSSSLA